MESRDHAPDRAGDQPNCEVFGERRPAGKAIVLFADGTGNAFTRQQSNVWRMYDALEVASPKQIAHYIPGVGTSGFRPWALIDSATGLGVPSNVRRLYEFLCWNYVENDRIYLFGFSRGAFTIRALVGMIDSEGLLSRTGQRGTASRPEMRRNVMSAWRAYRASRRRSFLGEAPTIKFTRRIRDAMLALRDFTFRYERYAAVSQRSDHETRVRFLGLFDTVEAYGVPLEEMRDAIDWAVWPIRFRNRKLSKTVEAARHALSLDDERQSFHPVRFDLSDPDDGANGRIREVWFAGAHSDVGGGYPDDQAALVPLDWMRCELRGELAFKTVALSMLRHAASSLAATHDSRSGFGNLYRYYPRMIGCRTSDGGPPTVHHSVIEKMVFGADRYAPHALPSEVQVLMPDGSRHQIQGFGPDAAAVQRRSPAAHGVAPTAEEIAEQALAALRVPDPAYVASVADAVWLRRKAYFLLLAGLLALACLPWTSSLFGGGPPSTSGETLTPAGYVATTNSVLAALVHDVASSITSVVPLYAQPWFRAAVAQPLIFALLVAATWLMYGANARLKDRIDDDARCAWFGSGDGQTKQPSRGPLLRLAEALRNRTPTLGKRGFFYWLWFLLTLAGLAILTFLGLDRVWWDYRVGSGAICKLDPYQKPRPVLAGTPEIAEGFATRLPCWDTGLFLEQGRAYSIKLEMTEAFLDHSIVADAGGFNRSSMAFRLAAPLKRWFSAPYFQPIARIGSQGMTELVLRPDDGAEPRTLGHEADVKSVVPQDICMPVVADPAEVEAIRAKLDLRQSLTARFVAPASGELFMYVNDAVFGSGLLARLLQVDGYDCFYRNNGGGGKITVEQLGAGR